MDHRWTARKETNYPIVLYHKPIGYIVSYVKNVSVDGMLVETGEVTLPKGVVVEIAATESPNLERKIELPKAFITRANQGLAGLMLISSVWKVPELWGVFEHDVLTNQLSR